MSKIHPQLSKHNRAQTASPIARALAGLATLAVAMGIGRFAFTPVMPMMLQDAGLNIMDGAWLASANYFGYLIGALSAMAVGMRPERAIRGGLLAICLTTLAMRFSFPLTVWLLLRLLAGVASAWVLVSVSAWCLETLSKYQRPFLNSLVFAGVGCGIAVAGLLCLALTQNNAGSANSWTALGLMAGITTILIWRFFPTDAPVANREEEISQIFKWNTDTTRLISCYGVFGFGYIIPATYLPVMAKNILFDPSLFGWSWPIFGLAGGVSTLLVAFLCRHMSNRRLWMVCQWIMAVGIMLPIFSPQMLTIFAATLCVGGTFMVITLAALQEAKQVAGDNARPLIAAMTSAFAGGQIIGPLTVNAASAGNASFSSGLAIASALLLVSTLLLRSTPT